MAAKFMLPKVTCRSEAGFHHKDIGRSHAMSLTGPRVRPEAMRRPWWPRSMLMADDAATAKPRRG